jgi:subtilisin family serine protease
MIVMLKQQKWIRTATLTLGLGLALSSLGLAPLENLITRTTAALLPFKESKTGLFGLQNFQARNWGLSNTQGSHINAVEAWKIEAGSRNVVVAVIDTGVDFSHEALSPNQWHDPNAGDQAVFGWNFVTNRPNPIDDHGHGTHVAGIIGAINQPRIGVSGVAPRVSIMAVKYYSDANSGAVNLANTVKAINYAVDHGANIINYSGGGPEFSEEEYMAIKRAEARGVLFVAAAGNEHQDTDKVENYYYPSAYRLSNIISVAATYPNNRLLSSSNWGKKKVDVAAPGEGIFSTLPGGRFGVMTGTSQATAFVSGLAALLLSKNPSLKPEEIKSIIMGSVDRLPTLQDRIATGGRINAYAALMAVQQGRLARVSEEQSAPGFLAGSLARNPVSLIPAAQ